MRIIRFIRKNIPLVLGSIFVFWGIIAFLVPITDFKIITILRQFINVDKLSIVDAFTIASVFFVIYSLFFVFDNDNKKNVREQFFKMIDYHFEKVNTAKKKHFYASKEGEIQEGQDYFKMISKNISEVNKLLNDIKKEKGYTDVDINTDMLNEITMRLNYYGCQIGDNMDSQAGRLLKYLQKIYSDKSKLPEFFNATISAIKEKNNSSNGIKMNLSDGYAFVLAGYFEQMLEIFKFVDTNDILTQKEKDDLMKIFRSMLSNSELLILAVFSISSFGKAIKEYVNKYKMISRLPERPVKRYELQKYFTNIKFDYQQRFKDPQK